MTSREFEIKEFPDNKLTSRLKLSYQWLSGNAENLLDAGCSYGYGTRYFKEKSTNTYAIDMDELHIEIAKRRYPGINFEVGSVEGTSFDNEMFDEILLNDVLEHTNDKIKTLSEMYRILKKGGMIVISTPHKGLFGVFDPYNYGYYFRKLMPGFYKIIYKFIRFIKTGIFPTDFNPVHLQKHYHYTFSELKQMLNESDFKDKYSIEKKFRSGLFFEVFSINLEILLGIFLSKRITRLLVKPFVALGNMDYWLNYGPFAYNIAIKVIKNS